MSSRSSGRPRLVETDDAILDATLKIIADEGYSRLGFERIAAVSGVAKATIYRRFKSRGEVVIEALQREAAKRWSTEPPVPTTVEAYVHEVFAAVSGDLGTTFRGLMADAQLNREFGEIFLETFIRPRRDALMAVFRQDARFDRACEADLAFAADLVFGPMWYRLLSGHAPIDAKLAEDACALLSYLARSNELASWYA